MQLEDRESLPISDLLQTVILKFVREGVLIISDRASSLYMNAKAQEICQKILQSSNNYTLPPIIAEIAQNFTQRTLLRKETIVQDFCLSDDCVLRIKAINIATNRDVSASLVERPWLLFLLEDKNDHLQEEIELAREKYGLTAREAEVYGLLSRSKTYQDISKTLHVSLNTVRSHVKNINEKKRSCYPT